MDILFIVDRLELKYFEFNKLVTNFWLIKEFLERNNNVWVTTIDNLGLRGQTAFANCYKSYVKDENITEEELSIIRASLILKAK